MKISRLYHTAQNLVVVTIIAALVWIYAESENTKTYQNQTVQLRFIGPSGATMVIEPAEVSVPVTLRGSVGQYQRFKELTTKAPIEIVVGQDSLSEATVETLVLVRELAQTELGELGMNILEASPDTLSIDVTPLKQINLPVRVSTRGLQVASEPPPRSDPEQVRVELPASLVTLAENATAEVRIPPERVNAQLVDEPQTLSLNASAPPGLLSPYTRLLDRSVQVSFTIRKITDEITIQRRALKLGLAPEFTQLYDVRFDEADQIIQDLRLTGPADVVARIKNGELASQVRVVADVSGEQLSQAAQQPDGRIEVPVQVFAPLGVTSAETLPTATLIVSRRSETP